MEKRDLFLEGNSKRVFSTDRESMVVLEFKDDFLEETGARKIKVPGKGEINAGISSFLFQYLENYHVPTHFVERLAGAELLVRRLTMIPIEVVVHNVAAGKLAQRFRLDEGQQLEFPVVEYFLKSRKLGNPMVNESHAVAFGYARPEEVRSMGRMASKTNAILKSLFERRGLALVDLKLEFGSTGEHICVADEISPDTCRIWDKKKNRRIDRDRLPHDIASLEKTYNELFDRLTRAL